MGKEHIAKAPFETIFRPGRPPEQGGHPGINHQVFRDEGLVIERDIAVKMRDGVEIYIDLFRPEGQEKVPVIIGWSPYGKFKSGAQRYETFPGETGVRKGQVSKYANFEFLDPVYWCHHGYALITVDPRGEWYSKGDATLWGTPQEGLDEYDLIEWAGTQPWSNSKVGLAGVSYYALSQWCVGALRPPHLAAINPWEGFSDPYRETAFHGGIPETYFTREWFQMVTFSTTRVEDLPAMVDAHPLFDDYWASKRADWSQIKVPAYVVASWADQGLHTRGTIQAFRELSSKQKWLEVHGRKKWEYFLQDESVERQRKFFDCFLKGIRNEVPTWPKVRLEVRDKYYVGSFRDEKEWPLARTDYRKLFLNAASASLDTAPISTEAQTRYNPQDDNQRAQFDFVFPEKTELTGNMKLHLWVEAIGSDDMDLFVGLMKVGPERSGSEVSVFLRPGRWRGSAWMVAGLAPGTRFEAFDSGAALAAASAGTEA
jgi:predicted acyl esterase